MVGSSISAGRRSLADDELVGTGARAPASDGQQQQQHDGQPGSQDRYHVLVTTDGSLYQQWQVLLVRCGGRYPVCLGAGALGRTPPSARQALSRLSCSAIAATVA